jgi:peptidoglycan/LPS O-acetylase OafA/YrhL
MAWSANRLGARWLSFEIAVLAAIAAVSLLIQGSPPGTDLHIWLFFSPLGRGLWFAFGLLLAAVSVAIAHRDEEPAFVDWVRHHAGVLVAAAALLYGLMVSRFPALLAYRLENDNNYIIAYVLCGIISVLLLVPLVFGADGGGFVRRTLGHRSLVWLGLVSYGIYLWHYPVMLLLLRHGITGFVPLAGLTFALTLVCAAASYYALERPMVRLGRRSHARTVVATG